MKYNFLTLLFSLISFCLLSACGGGESEESSTELGQLTFTELPSLSSADENSVVTLSLNVSGKGSKDLVFDWDVSLLGEEIAFTGQGTDTISFIAPEVTGNKSLSVNVDFDLSSGTLIGQTNDFTSITIYDLDPAPDASEFGKTTSLPEVDALSEAQLLNNSTWRLVHFETAITDIADIESRVNLSRQRIAYLNKNESETLTEEICGLETVSEIDPANFGDTINCTDGIPERKFYQNTSGFRMEINCSSSVVYASEYTKISDTKQSNFGSLSLELEFRDDIELNNNVCGTTSISQIVAPATSSNPLIITTSAISLFGTYEDEPINIAMIIDGPPEFGRSHFDDFFDTYNTNSITLNSSELPALDGLTLDEEGGITLLTSTLNDIEGRFDSDFLDSTGAAESIEGEFSFRFE